MSQKNTQTKRGSAGTSEGPPRARALPGLTGELRGPRGVSGRARSVAPGPGSRGIEANDQLNSLNLMRPCGGEEPGWGRS